MYHFLRSHVHVLAAATGNARRAMEQRRVGGASSVEVDDNVSVVNQGGQ